MSLGIVLDDVGSTYTSKGMIFVVFEFERTKGAIVAKCLLLDDNPKFTVRIPPGTVMDVEDWSSLWAEAMRIT